MCSLCGLTRVQYGVREEKGHKLYGLTIQERTMTALYYQLLCELLAHGREQQTRIGPSKELSDATLILREPEHCFPQIGRKANIAIGIAEGLQLVAGISDPRLMERITPNFKRYQDGSAFWGAYGVRTASQIPQAIEKLRQDPNSRQAVVTMWDPAYDNVAGRADYPCTVSITFRIRDGKLEQKTHMRSNDAWMGVPYDILQFTTLQHTVANVLDMSVGPYVHHVDSMHLYEEHWQKAVNLVTPSYSDVIQTQMPMHSLHGVTGDTWEHAANRARAILTDPTVHCHSDSEYFMSQQLEAYLEP